MLGTAFSVKELVMAYYKVRIEVWCDWNPAESDLEEIVQNTSTGEAICTKQEVVAVVDCPQDTCEYEQMKHRIVHLLQKYSLNPPIKFLLAIGIAPPGYALLETIGRKTGKARRTPVGDGRVGNQFWIVAEHGVKAGYVHNITTHPHIRLKLREGVRFAGITARHICSRKMIPGSAR